MQNIIRSISSFWNRSIQRQLMLGIALVHAVLMTIFVSDLVSRQRSFLNKHVPDVRPLDAVRLYHDEFALQIQSTLHFF